MLKDIKSNKNFTDLIKNYDNLSYSKESFQPMESSASHALAGLFTIAPHGKSIDNPTFILPGQTLSFLIQYRS